MRIAISGSHGTGKSTLVRELADRLPDFIATDEPYYLLAEEGHAFSQPPTFDDFIVLHERSLSLLTRSSSQQILFDRSPADYLAYLAALEPSAVSREQIADAAAAMSTLDLVVFVPIEQPDRVGGMEAPRLRRRVDEILREMLVENAWSFDASVLEVHGTPRERADQVRAHLSHLKRVRAAR